MTVSSSNTNNMCIIMYTHTHRHHMQMTTTTLQPRATKITHRSSDTTHVFEYGVGRSWF